ncbi:hypothetical protein EBX31_14860, partial [bacterium]|nr:hypothetical protein [bacterium]
MRGCQRLLAFLFFPFFGQLASSQAQSVLLGWDIPGSSSSTNSTNSYAPVTNAVGVESSGSILMGDGLTYIGKGSTTAALIANNAWGGASWGVFGTSPVPSTSVADAVANNDHFGFSIKSSIGYQT